MRHHRVRQRRDSVAGGNVPIEPGAAIDVETHFFAGHIFDHVVTAFESLHDTLDCLGARQIGRGRDHHGSHNGRHNRARWPFD